MLMLENGGEYGNGVGVCVYESVKRGEEWGRMGKKKKNKKKRAFMHETN